MNIKAKNKHKDFKQWLFTLLITFIVSLLVLFPTFNLHLSGDDYQSFWRYKEYYNGMIPGDWNDLKILLTDYGPQDLSMSFIQRHFGYDPQNFYIASYLLRLLAAFSFLPVVYYFTKSKTATFVSSLFFSIATTGLESTDWVFNMPVYIAISFLNLFLFLYFKSRDEINIRLTLLSGLLFAATILSMPIRMLFLPGILIISELFWIILKKDKKTFLLSFGRIIMFLLIIFTIFSSGDIGNSVTGYGGQAERNSLTKVAKYFSGVTKAIENNQLQILLYPIGQFGTIVFPNILLFPTRETISITKTITHFAIPLLVLLILTLRILRTSYPKIKGVHIFNVTILSIVWTILCFYIFKINIQYPLHTSYFIPMLSGGYLIFIVSYVLYIYKTNIKFVYYIFFALAIIFASFIQYWLRDSHIIQVTYGRYLIIPAVGLAFLIGIFVGFAKRKTPIIFLAIIVISLHMYASHKYVKRLSLVRDIQITTSIRNTIPNVFTEEKLEKPMVFYFQPQGSEILHHSLLFGFPVIMATKYDFMNIFNIVYTDNWSEVVSAHADGEGVRRFGAKVEPVPVENIYSFRLDGLKLVDVSDEIRLRLNNINR